MKRRQFFHHLDFARAPAIVGATAVATAQSALEVAPSKGTGLFTAAVARGLRGGAFAGGTRPRRRGCATTAVRHRARSTCSRRATGAMHPQRKAVLLRHFGADYNGERCSARGGDSFFFDFAHF